MSTASSTLAKTSPSCASFAVDLREGLLVGACQLLACSLPLGLCATETEVRTEAVRDRLDFGGELLGGLLDLLRPAFVEVALLVLHLVEVVLDGVQVRFHAVGRRPSQA